MGVLLVVVVILVGLTIVPVMIGARIVKAQNTGFGSALLAVVLLSALSLAIDHFISNDLIAFVASTVGGALILASVLNTTFLRGLAVSAIVVAVQFVVLLAFAGGLFGAASFAA